MTEQTDLFGQPTGPAQASLFGDAPNRLQAPTQSFLPDPELIRLRLNRVLNTARGADAMPWSERDARMWQTVFPNMANWLPEEEAHQLRLAFSEEMKRLSTAA